MQRAQTRTFATNSLFSAFILSIFGWGLLHAWAVQVNARPLLHLLIALPCSAVSGIVLYRYARHWPARQDSTGRRSTEGGLAPACRSTAWYCLLLLIGAGMAFLVLAGSALFLLLAALALGVLPWSRIPVCRDHFFIAAATAAGGAALGLAVSGTSIPQLYYPMSALFFLCTSSLMTVFIILMHGNRRDRMPVTGYS